jgi:hypothetical protein
MQLTIFIQGANEDFQIVEGLLELIPMKGKQVLMKLFLNQ